MDKIYDYRLDNDRKEMARSLELFLTSMGFQEFNSFICPGSKRRRFDKVFFLELEDNIFLMVYSGIAKSKSYMMKGSKTSIKMFCVYQKEGHQYLSGYPSIGLIGNMNTTLSGTIQDIMDLVMVNIASAYDKVVFDENCERCGSPMFISKRGNSTCADFCWRMEGNKESNNHSFRSYY